MARSCICLAFVLSSASIFALSASADLVGSDNASNSPYNDGWSVGDNGGTGFGAWSTINNQSGSGSGGGFLADNNSESQINTANKAWGVFGHTGGVGQAIRPFPTPLVVGQTFNIDMDNGLIDTGGTVGFGLQNSSGNNLFEFFFVGGQSTYTMFGSSSVATAIPFTQLGLRLSLNLTSTNAFSFAIDTLGDGVGINQTLTGNLGNPAGGQAISGLRLFNANAGAPNSNNVFFNNISAVPEVSPMLAVPAALFFAGTVSFGWRRWRAKPAVELA